MPHTRIMPLFYCTVKHYLVPFVGLLAFIWFN